MGYNDIFSQVDIVLCMLEEITECGFVFVFCFHRMIWKRVHYVKVFRVFFFNRTWYCVEYHARMMGVWVTAKRKPVVTMGDFIWITSNFLLVLRYYPIKLEISTECIIFIRHSYSMFIFLSQNSKSCISLMIATRSPPNLRTEFLTLMHILIW